MLPQPPGGMNQGVATGHSDGPPKFAPGLRIGSNHVLLPPLAKNKRKLRRLEQGTLMSVVHQMLHLAAAQRPVSSWVRSLATLSPPYLSHISDPVVRKSNLHSLHSLSTRFLHKHRLSLLSVRAERNCGTVPVRFAAIFRYLYWKMRLLQLFWEHLQHLTGAIYWNVSKTTSLLLRTPEQSLARPVRPTAKV